MARLRYVEVETATPDQQKILGQLTQKSGKIANIWKLWSHSPHTLEAFMAFYKTLMKGTLDPKLRELAYMKSSLINNCAYCAEAHKAAGRRVGIQRTQRFLVQIASDLQSVTDLKAANGSDCVGVFFAGDLAVIVPLLL